MQLVMDADRLELSLEGLEHLWAFKLAPVSVPLAHITRAEAALPPSSWRDIRAPGTAVPGLIKAGTYYTPRGRELWYVVRSRVKEPLTIELTGERYRRIVISIEDARGWADRINANLRAG
ncbi:MAG: hypothetical protein IT372_29675 [Polyangiaceae bacterium]|nr:hypothetical protein [Polyangiaceae bacterium]